MKALASEFTHKQGLDSLKTSYVSFILAVKDISAFEDQLCVLHPCYEGHFCFQLAISTLLLAFDAFQLAISTLLLASDAFQLAISTLYWRLALSNWR